MVARVVPFPARNRTRHPYGYTGAAEVIELRPQGHWPIPLVHPRAVEALLMAFRRHDDNRGPGGRR